MCIWWHQVFTCFSQDRLHQHQVIIAWGRSFLLNNSWVRLFSSSFFVPVIISQAHVHDFFFSSRWLSRRKLLDYMRNVRHGPMLANIILEVQCPHCIILWTSAGCAVSDVLLQKPPCLITSIHSLRTTMIKMVCTWPRLTTFSVVVALPFQGLVMTASWRSRAPTYMKVHCQPRTGAEQCAAEGWKLLCHESNNRVRCKNYRD